MICCPVCNSTAIQTFTKIKKLPLILFPVSASIRNKIIRKDLTSFICQKCHHIFTKNLSVKVKEIIYKKYYSYYPFENLESMQFDYRIPFNKIMERFVRKNITLLEIGCSSGKVLDSYNKYNIQAYGIDPSPLLNKNDKRLLSGFYENYEFPSKFDMIISKFSLEHCQNIPRLLKKINSDLKEDGLLLIQVPNIQTFIKNAILMFVAHEHVHYFSPYSLFLMLKKNNFGIIAAEFEDKQSIIFVLRKKITSAISKPVKINKMPLVNIIQYKKIKKSITGKIKKIIKKEICLYGSGLTCSWLLYELNFSEMLNKSQIIDDNPLVSGRFMPYTSKLNQIKNLSLIKADKNLNFLLTVNPAYYKLIMEKISKKFPGSSIYFINNRGINLLK